MDDKIIPFGRYKGKSLEELASDKSYIQWLLAQNWFKEKHITLYNFIVNNFREPVDTPEHNKLQIKFLKHEYRLKLAYLVNKNLFANNSQTISLAMLKILKNTERNENEFFLKALVSPMNEHHEEFGLYTKQLLHFNTPTFEHVDVSYAIWYGIHFHYDNNRFDRGWSNFNVESKSTYSIEIKPSIGDDFPAVLRQMKASMPVVSSSYSTPYYILLVGNYTGVGATREEFIEYFGTQGYRVVFEKDVESLILPNYERELILDQEILDMMETMKN